MPSLNRGVEHVRILIKSLEDDIEQGVIVYGSSRIIELIEQFRAIEMDLEKGQPRVECHYCGRMIPGRKATKDHIVPKSRGGANARYNIVWSCIDCNQAKGNKMPTCDCEKCREAVRRYWQRPDVTSSYK